jgi:hypothetical protein
MNPLDLVLAGEALTFGRARPRRALRHVHVEDDPIAIAAIQMANEPYSLWAALVGTRVDKPTLIVAPEPRNRDIAYAALTDLGTYLCRAVDAAAAQRVDIPRRAGLPWRRVRRAPQLLVANPGVVALLDRLGRRMRPAGYGSDTQVPPELTTGGAHLGFYAETADHPGSSLILVATRELARHMVTGQSDLEDAHLGAQLAWWDPGHVETIKPGLLGAANPTLIHGADAANLMEAVPIGPITDPDQDNTIFINLVETFNRARAGSTDPKVVRRHARQLTAALRAALEPTWRALWIAQHELAAIPAAPGAYTRWNRDLDLFTRHVDYIASGGRRASIDSPRRAALLLADWEGAYSALERDETLQDPLALAAAVAGGQAITGNVTAVDTTHQELGPSGTRMVARPLVTLEIDIPSPYPVGTELWWTERPGQTRVLVQAVVENPGGATITLKVVAGMTGPLPAGGDTVTFSGYTTQTFMSPRLPDRTPWTHTSPDAGNSGSDLDTGPTIDVALGLLPAPANP